jgi:hypothetical protein
MRAVGPGPGTADPDTGRRSSSDRGEGAATRPTNDGMTDGLDQRMAGVTPCSSANMPRES